MARSAALAFFPACFLLVLVAWPIVAVLQRSLIGVGPISLWEIGRSPGVVRVVGFTLWQAALSAVVTLAIGLPVAHLLARRRFPGRSLLAVVVAVPFVLPTVVVGAAVRSVFESTIGSFVDSSLAAILFAHAFFNLAVIARLVGGHWSRLDDRRVEVAATLGASPTRAWLTVTARELAPAIISATLLVFLFSFTSFGVIRVLGGLRVATVETEIHRYAIARGEFDVAAVLAMIQILVVTLVAVSASYLQRRSAAVQARSGRSVALRGGGDAVRLGLVLIVVGVVVVGPIVGLVEQSLRVGEGYGFGHYRALGSRVDVLPTTGIDAVTTSIIFALLAAMVAVVVGVPAAAAIARGGWIGRGLELLAVLPLGVSAVTLGFGYLVGLTVFDLRSWIGLVPAAHAVVGLPFVLAALLPAIRSVDSKVREVAATLGASPGAILKTIDWPASRGAILAGAGFAGAVSLGEFGATSFLGRTDGSFTAPLAIFRLLSSPGPQLRGQALALSVVIGLLVVVPAVTTEIWLNRRTEKRSWAERDEPIQHQDAAR